MSTNSTNCDDDIDREVFFVAIFMFFFRIKDCFSPLILSPICRIVRCEYNICVANLFKGGWTVDYVHSHNSVIRAVIWPIKYLYDPVISQSICYVVLVYSMSFSFVSMSVFRLLVRLFVHFYFCRNVEHNFFLSRAFIKAHCVDATLNRNLLNIILRKNAPHKISPVFVKATKKNIISRPIPQYSLKFSR